MNTLGMYRSHTFHSESCILDYIWYTYLKMYRLHNWSNRPHTPNLNILRGTIELIASGTCGASGGGSTGETVGNTCYTLMVGKVIVGETCDTEVWGLAGGARGSTSDTNSSNR